jgi:hypothetical protein
MGEEKARISKKALVQVRAALDAERTKAESTHQYLNKIEAHTARGRHFLDVDKMLGKKMVELDGREQDLELCSAVLAEALAQGPNP